MLGVSQHLIVLLASCCEFLVGILAQKIRYCL